MLHNSKWQSGSCLKGTLNMKTSAEYNLLKHQYMKCKTVNINKSEHLVYFVPTENNRSH